MRFLLQNYNEFKNHMRWHDYLSIMINEFAVILVRRYDWMETEESTFTIQILGFDVFKKIWKWK